jgi:hypothetical protein
LVTTSENSGIFFWNYLGDLTFTETELNQELDKLGKIKETNRELLLKNTKNLNTFSSKKGLLKGKQTDHLDKIYNLNNSVNKNYNDLYSKTE